MLLTIATNNQYLCNQHLLVFWYYNDKSHLFAIYKLLYHYIHKLM